ncbi:cyclin domain-containing protein [Hirsutella rhossiliensis]|uniref:Cyclin domain-containing protein n=1 Tax=Hirsutella rhossiliensis TaxID=111463 RepID=A0A9P8MVY5_9HYPO|nr:cyclin domain-containing protein [Hirsutella rhossiliensis]KAH0961394.1 cyclin domain-containing protein [Hirsutella rhossiliensis]
MSTAYHPAMPAYDGHAIRSYPSSAMAHVGRSRTLMDETRGSQHYRGPPQPTQPAPAFQARNSSLSTTPLHDTASRRPARPSTPTLEAVMTTKKDGDASRNGSETLIYHSLQIPKCISPDGGNLSDFAAHMTCLFWFDAADNLKKAETIRSRPLNAPIPRLPSLAKPWDQFRKWVHNVLSTTQIKGRAGSEYRLLTVALMLGNKFLDDNTYTNKTWAEVSCFAVQEIHVMEVEFLSNMRYNLLASKEEWEGWLVKLSCFYEYYERARHLPASPIRNPSPTNNVFSSPIPSPTATALPGFPDMSPYTPSALSTYSPSSCTSKTLSAYHTNPTSPLSAKPSMNLAVTRKRSPDQDLADHPAKRQILSRAGHGAPNLVMNARTNCPVDAARLPVPQLSIVTNQGRNLAGAYTAVNGYPPQMPGTSQHIVSLPPLQPGIRAISTVYQSNPVTTMAQQSAMPASAGTPMPTTPFQIAPLAGHATMNYGTPTKHHSPGNLAPFGSSPLVEHLGPGVYLQQRASPYKPIRHVNTLLYPPPSASLDQYHLSVPVQPNQMHYQPLGRRHDVRTGVVPEFVLYNRGQQHLASQGGQQGHYPS